MLLLVMFLCHCGTGCRCCDPGVESHVVRVVGQTFVVTLRVWELCQTHTSGPASDSRNKLQHLELSSGLTSDDLLALGQPFFEKPRSQHNVRASLRQPTLLDVYCFISSDKQVTVSVISSAIPECRKFASVRVNSLLPSQA